MGAWVRGKGALLFLPPIRYDEKAFLKYDKSERARIWTPEALKFGKRLCANLVVRDLGFIEYDGDIKVNSSLLTVVLHDHN